MLALLLALLTAGPSAPAPLADAIILVGPRGTPAYEFAQSRENGSTVFAQRKLWRALQQAAELLNEGGQRTVTVGVSQGDYDGEFGAGVQKIPRITNPDGTLKLLAGFNDDFSGRQPFAFHVRVPTIWGRDGAIVQMENRSSLRELVVSGLILDASPSNKYDARTNSLLQGESRHYPIMSFGGPGVEVQRLVVADNVFINGAVGALRLGASPPRGTSGEVVIQNNFFLNNIRAFDTQTFGQRVGAPFGRLVVRHNSFLLNFPYRPDPDAADVSTVKLYHRDAFDEMVFDRNIFAYNPGGVFQHDWPQDRMGDLVLRENLFFLNGVLWGESAPEAAVVAGKFGTGAVYRVLDLYDVEDDLDGEMSGNVAFDPNIPVAFAPLQAASSSGVSAEPSFMNNVRRLFGANTDGGTVAIANFAPQMAFDARALPFPINDEAKPYGVQPALIWGATGSEP
ncbi:hypothetical protein [Rubrivirga sp. IMCC45206]|uniref:hypothetical protein n=1 Tax=Rubrivirga sp. IMCC45206 TaxID=3391614 RepID=UPI0039900037